MSQWLTDTLAFVETIFKGAPEDTATKDAVTKLQERLDSDEADEAEQKQVITALVAKLAASTPAA